MTKNKIPACSVMLFCFLGIFLSNCGRQEGTGGVLGAVGGGLVGHAVAGKKDKTAGLLIGGLLGSIVGREMGKAGDEEEELTTTIKDRELVERRRKMEELQEENERLRISLIKWCSNCGRRNEIPGAHSCPTCGATLIREKYCTTCSTIFSPQSGYKYCPYCKDHVLLGCR